MHLHFTFILYSYRMSQKVQSAIWTSSIETECKAGMFTAEQKTLLVPHKLWTEVQAALILQNEWCNHLQWTKVEITSWGVCCLLLHNWILYPPFTSVTKPCVFVPPPSSVWDIHPKSTMFMPAWTIIMEAGQGSRNMHPSESGNLNKNIHRTVYYLFFPLRHSWMSGRKGSAAKEWEGIELEEIMPVLNHGASVRCVALWQRRIYLIRLISIYFYF